MKYGILLWNAVMYCNIGTLSIPIYFSSKNSRSSICYYQILVKMYWDYRLTPWFVKPRTLAAWSQHFKYWSMDPAFWPTFMVIGTLRNIWKCCQHWMVPNNTPMNVCKSVAPLTKIPNEKTKWSKSKLYLPNLREVQ